MKPRVLVIVLSVGALITTVAMVGRQRQLLADLHSQVQALQSRAEALTNEAPAETEAPVAAAPQTGPSLELLRLRSQVGQLERRKRELAGVTEENKRLQTQLAAKATNAPGVVALPAGYIRKSEAKRAGFGTPEDSLQSFLWAIEHRDLPTLMQFFGPDQAKQMASEVERRGSAEDFFKDKDTGALPGFSIIGREQKDDSTIVLSVQIVPGDEPANQKMRFKQIDGQWRLVPGF
jgi:hypothetical protein